MLRLIAAGLLLAACSMPAQSAGVQDIIKGVYLGSQELCDQAKKDGVQKLIEAGNVVLSVRGLESIEYNCEFVQSVKGARSPTWAVTAICQEPGFTFPDLLSVTEMSPTQLDLVSVTPADEENPGNSGSYFLCDGLKLP